MKVTNKGYVIDDLSHKDITIIIDCINMKLNEVFTRLARGSHSLESTFDICDYELNMLCELHGCIARLSQFEKLVEELEQIHKDNYIPEEEDKNDNETDA